MFILKFGYNAHAVIELKERVLSENRNFRTSEPASSNRRTKQTFANTPSAVIDVIVIQPISLHCVYHPPVYPYRAIGAVLFQLSEQANWELLVLMVCDKPVK